jgi:hypothetical protein
VSRRGAAPAAAPPPPRRRPRRGAALASAARRSPLPPPAPAHARSPAPAPLRCVNVTGAPVAAPAYPAPAAPAGPSTCAPLPAPGGTATAAGLWLNAAEDAATLSVGGEWATIRFRAGEELAFTRGKALAHECLAPGEVATASAVQSVWANGTGAEGFSCGVEARTGATTYTARGGAGATDGFNSSSWEAVPGADVTVAEGTPTCGAAAAPAGAPEAPPEVAPASSSAAAAPSSAALAAVVAVVTLWPQLWLLACA